jgi:hypothetical protein
MGASTDVLALPTDDLSKEEVPVKNLPGLLMVISARLKGWFGSENKHGSDSKWLTISDRLRIIGHSFDRPYDDADASAMLERLHADLAMYQMRSQPSSRTVESGELKHSERLPR